MDLVKNNILGIDTATSQTVITLNGRVLQWTSNRNQSKELLPKIDRLLKTCKIKPTQLRGVVVNLGPGSFTGLRVGATVANGIGYGVNIPVKGLTEFQIIRAAEQLADTIILDAGRNEVFIEQPKKSASLIVTTKLPQLLRAGERVLVNEPRLMVKLHHLLIKPGTIVVSGLDRSKRLKLAVANTKLPTKFHQVLPVYLREANITKPRPKAPSKI